MLKHLNLDSKQKKRLAVYIALSLVVCVFMKTIGERIAYSYTDSVGYNLFYYKKGTPSELKKGDMVVFPISINEKLVPNCNPCRLTKIVGCAPGQRLTTNGKQFFCDGHYLGTAKDESIHGVPVSHITYNGIVPENQYFLTGTCKDSYDSKYFGLIPKNQIVGTAIPLL
jgi:type IV secretory pathway protease TraF